MPNLPACSAPNVLPDDQRRLKKIGESLRARLSANPRAYRIPTEQVEIWAVGDFMDPLECARMIALIDAQAKPSTVFDLEYSSGYRTSYSGNVDPNDPFVQKIQRKLDDLLGIDPTYGETVQGQRYQVGQEFKPHNDWFHEGTSYWNTEMTRGGQRSITAMVFLNDVPGGGHTEFTDIQLSIEPKQGVLLIWNNADAEGVPNPLTMHAGRPVTEGTKYIITKWYRGKRWF